MMRLPIEWIKPAVATSALLSALTGIAMIDAISLFAKIALAILLTALGGAIVTGILIARSKNDDTSNPNEMMPVDRRTAVRMVAAGTLATGAALALPSVLKPAVQPARAASPEQAGPAGRTRQWMMIIDLRRCDGCQSQATPPKCTAACIEGRFVPEPMEWIEAYEEEIPGGGTRFLPAPCQQCQNAPCVAVCPVGATFATPEGVVLIDQNRCIGCRICMAACPYDRRFFNWGEPPIPTEAQQIRYSIEHQAPARPGTVMKCDFCPDVARAGFLPFCVQGCPQNAIYYGDLEEDVASNGRDLVKISSYLSENDAYRQKDELGTHPRVYYIPGHGEAVGRDPYVTGRMETTWNWAKVAEGGETWSR